MVGGGGAPAPLLGGGGLRSSSWWGSTTPRPRHANGRHILGGCSSRPGEHWIVGHLETDQDIIPTYELEDVWQWTGMTRRKRWRQFFYPH